MARERDHADGGVGRKIVIDLISGLTTYYFTILTGQRVMMTTTGSLN
jgi:hypothetical protein